MAANRRNTRSHARWLGACACRPSLLALAVSAAFAAPAMSAPVAWIGASSFWDLATNWSSNPALPGALDDVSIDVALVRTVTVRATGGPFAVGSLSLPGDDGLTVNGGSLTVGAGFTNNAATTLTSGTLSLNGLGSSATLTQSSGGVLSGVGVFSVTGNAALGGTHSGPGTTVLKGTSAIGSLNLDAGRALRNEGTATLAGTMNLNSALNTGSGRIENAAGAVFDVRTYNLSIYAGAFADRDALSGYPAFNNAGTLRKSTSGNYTIAVPVNNTGTVEVLAGSFSFSGGGSQTAASSIAIAAGTNLTFNGGTHVMNGGSVTGDGRLQLSGGVLDIAKPQTIASGFTQSGGVLQGLDLTLNGPATLAGTQTGPATTLLKGASIVSGLNLDAGRVLRNEGTVTLSGGMNLNPADNTGAGRVDNAAGALFDVRTYNLSIAATGHADLNALPGQGVFNNAGTFRKSTSGGYGVSVPFVNTGSIDVQVGSFSFNAGSSHGGSVTIASGAGLTLAAGTHDFNAGAGFTGPGTLTLSGAGTVFNINAATTIDSAFTQNAGTLQGRDLTLTGVTSLAINSSVGVMTGAGTTHLQGATSIGNFGLDAKRVLSNEATTVVIGSIQLNRSDAAGAGRIDNAAGALFDVRTFNHGISASDFALDAGLDAAFNNAGTLRKSTGVGTYGVGVAVNNLANGVVDVQAGSFNFSRGGSHSGAATLAAGTTLAFGGGMHAVNGGASFSGAGNWAVSGAGTVVDIAGPLTVRSGFSHSGGTIQGSDLVLQGRTDLSIDSSLGMMSGAATTTLQGSTRIGGVNAYSLDAKRVLRNEGDLVLVSSIQLNRTVALGAGRIENAASGVIDIQTYNLSIVSAKQSDLDHGRDARFDNAGLLKKTTALNYSIAVPFFNTGVVSVEKGTLTINDTVLQAGTIRVASGATYNAGSVLANLGTLQGGGTIAGGTVSNRGVIGPGNSPGTLSIDGNFEQLADGRLDIELAGLTDFDVLNVSGSASLAGGLQVIRFGDYAPVVGDEFTILSSTGALSGTFDSSSPSLSGFADGVRFGVRYDYALHTVTLEVLAVAVPVPEPATWALLLAGLGAIGFAARRRVGRGAPGPR